jgi:hypothetical protein
MWHYLLSFKYLFLAKPDLDEAKVDYGTLQMGESATIEVLNVIKLFFFTSVDNVIKLFTVISYKYSL